MAEILRKPWLRVLVVVLLIVLAARYVRDFTSGAVLVLDALVLAAAGSLLLLAWGRQPASARV